MDQLDCRPRTIAVPFNGIPPHLLRSAANFQDQDCKQIEPECLELNKIAVGAKARKIVENLLTKDFRAGLLKTRLC